MKNKKAIIIATLIGILIITGAFLYNANQTYAVTGFGGKIVGVNFCWCTSNLAVYVAGFQGGTFIFQPGVSQLFAFGQIFRPGPDVLGISGGVGVCRFGTCTEPGTITITGQEILMVGTSF
ncbi:MAG: hypothetical protein COU10_00370 [Candidatus Harrisonbacteria bacterium CG10_big_fil_rev_8_21_14_0_10_45_28]|uniref:Uncharacterized protein n=1 Tax=Candidatus Harrisonbacteria bacterium CG10_big_fil_rev_8_21_14_0_10_45_28 TaxID=1974586 RepID=A0A2H0UP93_9BACT|nr:MAG: hypothetical protein COU10_00370 [Candidatus Harrisonbacteria bacterium CG10_big_fil_rev_8_21_14_0_10_45_28]